MEKSKLYVNPNLWYHGFFYRTFRGCAERDIITESPPAGMARENGVCVILILVKTLLPKVTHLNLCFVFVTLNNFMFCELESSRTLCLAGHFIIDAS